MACRMIPWGNAKLQFQMHSVTLQLMGEILAKYAT